MHASPFSLTKWYMDCVTEAGDVAVVYCAELRWRGIHAALGSVLSGNEGKLNPRTSISRYRISCDDALISVDMPKLGVSGRWQAGAAPVERTVYEQSLGRVHWNCLQPRSKVLVRIGDRELEGLGYAECLTMTVPPWKLPMRQLRWGRFVSSQDSLAWVDWQGTWNTSFAFLNGSESKPVAVSESEVVLPAATLRIEAGLPLRSGRLGSTILPGASGLARLFPASLFSVEEHKWRSRGALTANERTSTGWVIHEVVHWKV